MICAECGAEMRQTSEPITEEYKGEKITVPGIEHFQCDECGNYEIGCDEADELSRHVANEYARRMGLLAPEEIASIRRKLKFTQKQFESMLGVSSPSVSRWENGAVQQSKPVDKLMRVIRDVPDVARYLTECAELSYATAIFTADISSTRDETEPLSLDLTEVYR